MGGGAKRDNLMPVCSGPVQRGATVTIALVETSAAVDSAAYVAVQRCCVVCVLHHLHALLLLTSPSRSCQSVGTMSAERARGQGTVGRDAGGMAEQPTSHDRAASSSTSVRAWRGRESTSARAHNASRAGGGLSDSGRRRWFGITVCAAARGAHTSASTASPTIAQRALRPRMARPFSRRACSWHACRGASVIDSTF